MSGFQTTCDKPNATPSRSLGCTLHHVTRIDVTPSGIRSCRTGVAPTGFASGLPGTATPAATDAGGGVLVAGAPGFGVVTEPAEPGVVAGPWVPARLARSAARRSRASATQRALSALPPTRPLASNVSSMVASSEPA